MSSKASSLTSPWRLLSSSDQFFICSVILFPVSYASIELLTDFSDRAAISRSTFVSFSNPMSISRAKVSQLNELAELSGDVPFRELLLRVLKYLLCCSEFHQLS